jgi:hypothetical protein
MIYLSVIAKDSKVSRYTDVMTSKAYFRYEATQSCYRQLSLFTSHECITLHSKVLIDYTQGSLLVDWCHLIGHFKHYQSLMGLALAYTQRATVRLITCKGPGNCWRLG